MRNIRNLLIAGCVLSVSFLLTPYPARASFVVVGLSSTWGTTAGDDANSFEGAGNAVNLVNKPLRLDDATTLAQGPGTLPSFGFHNAANYPGGQQRNSGFGNATEVRRDRKQNNAALILDENNDAVFNEAARSGFGMVADGFITFDLDKIRADNGRPAGEDMVLNVAAGVINVFPTATGGGGPHTSGMILLDGVMLNLFDWTDAGYTGSGPKPVGYDQFDTYKVLLPGGSKYLTFAALSGLDVGNPDAFYGSDVGFDAQLTLPEPACAMTLGCTSVMMLARRRRVR